MMTSGTIREETLHGPLPVREKWLSTLREDVIEPELPIIDAHQHLWTRPHAPYMVDAYLADVESGHNIIGSVYVQCSSMYRQDGPAEMRPIGEVEFANGVAAMSASGLFGSRRLCAGIVGAADLSLGERVRPVLEASMRAGGSRFKGIRTLAAWSPIRTRVTPDHESRPGVLADAAFRKGFAVLNELRLRFDVHVYHWQLAELADLSRAFPETTIIVNHCGAPVMAGTPESGRGEIRKAWQAGMKALADSGNVVIKLGGLASRLSGSMLHEQDVAPSSMALADHFRQYLEPCLDYFGPRRCMFESNFPVDKGQSSYRTLWNAFKRVTKACSDEDKHRLFHETARIVYGLDLAAGQHRDVRIA